MNMTGNVRRNVNTQRYLRATTVAAEKQYVQVTQKKRELLKKLPNYHCFCKTFFYGESTLLTIPLIHDY